MAINSFKVGDMVRLADDCGYGRHELNPRNTPGKVSSVEDIFGDIRYRVEWSNGKKNGAYFFRDLTPLSETNTTNRGGAGFDDMGNLIEVGDLVLDIYPSSFTSGKTGRVINKNSLGTVRVDNNLGQYSGHGLHIVEKYNQPSPFSAAQATVNTIQNGVWVDEYSDVQTAINKLKNNKMQNNVITKYTEMNIPEPQKSFIKAGIVDAQGLPTSDGVKVILAYWLTKNATDFMKDVVAGLVKEDEDKKE